MAQQIKITQTSNADTNIGAPKNLTAVEWLVEQLIPKAMVTYDTTTYNAIQQAKAMEKEQITEAFDEGQQYNSDKQYFNETFGGL
jgi:hypothetical protein